MNQFSELKLSPSIHHNLARNQFNEPTPVQAQAIPAALSGADVVATAQTGTGKTLAFLLPIAEKLLGAAAANKGGIIPSRIEALILSPTRELAIQIHTAFGELALGTGLRSAVIVGGMSEQTQISALKRGVHIAIATPGRLEDFLDRGLIDLRSVNTLVLDEADRMLDMGFLPAIEKILAGLPAARQSLFFSATMDRTVERLIGRHSKNPVRIAVGDASAKPPEQIDLHVYEVEHDKKIGLLRHMLTQETGSFLVFVRTKHGTDRVAKGLARSGMRAVAMHGDRTQNQRNQALAGFRDGRYRVLVATDVAARGIHVDSVAHVVNYDLPQAPMDFIHRIGRTGRAGQGGTASTFSLRSERGEIRRIERECRVRLIQQSFAAEIISELSMRPADTLEASASPERRPAHFSTPAQQNRRLSPGGFHSMGKRQFGNARGKSAGR